MNDTDLAALAEAWERLELEQVLREAADRFGSRITLASAFGLEDCVLIDAVARAGLSIEIFFLDTGLMFPETYELRRRIEARYSLKVRAVPPPLTPEQQAAEHGPNLWERDPDGCCGLRKIAPLRTVLAENDAWITGIRRDQSPHRAGARLIEKDAIFGLLKINPLATWTAKDVWTYCRQHDVPTNPLFDQGYASIGCQPCTSALNDGEGGRAGRWRGHTKTECGLHLPPRK